MIGMEGRRLVIPDIHGCNKSLVALMDKLKANPKDQLYFLGDYIDRGPDSKAVLDFLINLIEDGFQVHTLKGNHEQMLLDIAKFDKHSLKSHARAFNILGLIDGDTIIPKYLDFLNKLTYYIELEDFFLVHAGFNFNETMPFEDKKAMLWIRGFEPSAKWQRNKPIIHGHVPTTLKEIQNAIHQKSLKIPLDNGCVYAGTREDQGNLICLNLDTFELVVQKSIDD